MAQTRSDIRTRVRDYIYESVADIITDTQLNTLFLEELRSLPAKGIYLEELWTTSTVENQEDYTLPTGSFKAELVERNEGTTTAPRWVPIVGVDNYAGAIYLPYLPSTTESIRIKVKKKFTEVTDDSTALDLPDDKTEVLVWGIVVKAYKILIGYYRNDKSWDSVTKPGDVGLSSLQAWLRDAKSEYKDLIKMHASISRPRDIDLVG